MYVDRHRPPYKTAGAIFLVLTAAVATLIYLQFRGDLTEKTHLTLLSPRAGLVVEPGSKVTYNGVQIGRVSHIEMVDRQGTPMARLTLDVYPKYIKLIPANVTADIKATTVFGNKYISFSSPSDPTPQRISTGDVIDASAVTTEFNTLFETVTSIAEQVDPIKLNQTLSATAEALTGLGEKFGESLENGNQILGDLNPQMPQIQDDTRKVADLADVYADAAPDLWNGLQNAVRTAQTFNDQRSNIDAALMAAVGFGNDAADSFNRGGPYLVRGAADLVPTTELLDDYQRRDLLHVPQILRRAKRAAAVLGGNGYSLASESGALAGAGNPYIYPDNLPRVNATAAPKAVPAAGRTSREIYGLRRIW